MRTTLLVFLLAASATFAAGLNLDLSPGQKRAFVNCQVDAGTAFQASVARNGVYLVTVTDKDTTVCMGDCTDGGVKMPIGAYLINIPASTPLSCISSDDTGDVTFVRTF